MPKLKLTAAAVSKLTPPEAGRVDYFDTTLPAFGLRISHTGARQFFLMTRINGQLARLTIGRAKAREGEPGFTLAEARLKAGELAEMAHSGVDPRQVKARERQDNAEKAGNTFVVVGKRFMEQYVEPKGLSPNSAREYRRALFGPDTAAWAKQPVASITRADVRAVLDAKMTEGKGGAANNLLTHLGKFFNWCAEKDLVDVPPTARISPPGTKIVGERTLAHAEIAEVWAAFEASGSIFSDLFKLLLLTGQRRAEVAGMRRAELSGLDGDSPTWEIPAARTKNGRPHVVPLAPAAVAIIRARPDIGEAGFLFSRYGGTAASGFSRAKGLVDASIAEGRAKDGRPPMPEWTLHDLRRTMVTGMNEDLGISPHVVEAVVNHVSGAAKAGVAGVYNKAKYLRERQAALTAWASFVSGLRGENRPSNVIPLTG
jgi:integrase